MSLMDTLEKEIDREAMRVSRRNFLSAIDKIIDEKITKTIALHEHNKHQERE